MLSTRRIRPAAAVAVGTAAAAADDEDDDTRFECVVVSISGRCTMTILSSCSALTDASTSKGCAGEK